MHKSRGVGIAFMLLGLVYLNRSAHAPTYSRVGMAAGILMVIVGAVYAARARRRAAPLVP